VPIIATRAVDAIIRRDDDVKNAVVGPMMRAEWPTTGLSRLPMPSTTPVLGIGSVAVADQAAGPERRGGR
jgi:hypothetical protein